MGRRSSIAWLCIALLWTSEVSALESGGFTLETGSPDALCPELEATREIVARRLGSLIVEGRKGWLARYTIGHAPSGNPRDFVRLELFNPEGGVELRRDLPIEGDSCRTMSEVIALVLDRHFRGLVATETMDANAQSAAPAPAPAAAAAAPPVNLASSEEDAQPPREPIEASHRALRGAGPRVSAEYAATLAEAYLGLQARAGLGASLEAGLGLRWGLTSLEEGLPRGARVEANTVLSRASLAWRLALPPGLLHLGPALSVALQRATTRGLESPSKRTRALWMAGLEAGFLTPLARRWFVEGSTSLDLLIPGAAGQFLVDNREVLSPHTVTFGWALGFGYVWSE